MERRQRRDFGPWDRPSHGGVRSGQAGPYHQQNIAYPGTGPPAEFAHGGTQPPVQSGIRDHQQSVAHQEYDEDEQRTSRPGGGVSDKYFQSQSMVSPNGGGHSAMYQGGSTMVNISHHGGQQPGIPPHYLMSGPEPKRIQHDAQQSGVFQQGHSEYRRSGGHEGQHSDLPPHRGPGPNPSTVEGGKQTVIPPRGGSHMSGPEPRQFQHGGQPAGVYYQGLPEYRNSGFGRNEVQQHLPPHRVSGPDTTGMEGDHQPGTPLYGGPHKSGPESRFYHDTLQTLHSEHRNSLGGHEGLRSDLPPHTGPDPDTFKMEVAQHSSQQPGILPHGGPLRSGPEPRRFQQVASQSRDQRPSEYSSSFSGQEGQQRSELPPHRGPGPNAYMMEGAQHIRQQPLVSPNSGSHINKPDLRRFQHNALQSGVSHHGHSEYRSSGFGEHEAKQHSDLPPQRAPGPDTYKMEGAQNFDARPHGKFHLTGLDHERSEYRGSGSGQHERQRSDLPPHRDTVPDTYKMEGAQHYSRSSGFPPNSGLEMGRLEPKPLQPSGLFHHGPSQARSADFRHEGCSDAHPYQVPTQGGQKPSVPLYGGPHITGPELRSFHHGQSQPANVISLVDKECPDLPYSVSPQDSYKMEGSQYRNQHTSAPLHGVSPLPHIIQHEARQSGVFTHPLGINFGRREGLDPAVPPPVSNIPHSGEIKQTISSFGGPNPQFSVPAAAIHRPPPNDCNPPRTSPAIVQHSPAPIQPGPGQSVLHPNHPFPVHYFPPPFHVPPPNPLFPPPQMGIVRSGPHVEGEPKVSHPEMQKEEHLSPFGVHKQDVQKDTEPIPRPDSITCEISVQHSHPFISQTTLQSPSVPLLQPNVQDIPRDPQVHFYEQPKNIDQSRPTETFDGPETPSDRDLFQMWLSGFLSHKKKPSAKPNSVQPMPISEARELIYGALNLVSRLSALCQTLEDTTSEGESWAQKYEKAADIRVELQRRMKELEKPGYIQSVKTKLERVRKKRLRCQRKKSAREEEEKEAAERALETETRIDRWRMQCIHEVEEKKKERELKAAADSVLGEVRKKQTDAKKMLDVLKSLEKLRKLRKEAAARKGVSPPPDADETFKNHITRLRTMVHKRIALYDAEERALRVIVEGEQEEERQREKEKRLRKEREKILQKQRELDSLLFGDDEPLPGLHPLQPFRHFYLQAENSVVSLVQIRHAWDQFLAPPDHPDASSIPRGWVPPEPPSSHVWATAIKQVE